MAGKDDRENPGDDLGQRQYQFLLELSSAPPDTVSLQGIVLALMMQSNDEIKSIIIYKQCYFFFAHSIGAT